MRGIATLAHGRGGTISYSLCYYDRYVHSNILGSDGLYALIAPDRQEECEF